LQDLRLDDLDELFRFRLGNKPRLWGIIHEGVFFPVWWDPEHKIYPTDPGNRSRVTRWPGFRVSAIAQQ
jgi:hypothetical protein